MVLKHDLCEPFRFLRRHGYGPPGGSVALDEFPDARVQAALGDAGFKVIGAVDANDLGKLLRRYPGDVKKRVAEFRTDHRVQLGRGRDPDAELGKGRGDSSRYSPRRIDKSAVQVEDHGHC